jgi:hypothetical protein
MALPMLTKHGRYVVALRLCQRLPRRRRGTVRHRSRGRRHGARVRQRAEQRLVLGAVVLRDDVCVLRPAAAVLHGALQRPQRLRPLAVLATVPEEERRVRRARHRHRPPVRRAHALRQRHVVLELPLRPVARGARHGARAAEPRVEEEPVAKRDGTRIVGEPVGRIRRQLLERPDPERLQFRHLGFAPAVGAHAGRGARHHPRARQQDRVQLQVTHDHGLRNGRAGPGRPARVPWSTGRG